MSHVQLPLLNNLPTARNRHAPSGCIFLMIKPLSLLSISSNSFSFCMKTKTSKHQHTRNCLHCECTVHYMPIVYNKIMKDPMLDIPTTLSYSTRNKHRLPIASYGWTNTVMLSVYITHIQFLLSVTYYQVNWAFWSLLGFLGAIRNSPNPLTYILYTTDRCWQKMKAKC